MFSTAAFEEFRICSPLGGELASAGTVAITVGQGLAPRYSPQQFEPRRRERPFQARPVGQSVSPSLPTQIVPPVLRAASGSTLRVTKREVTWAGRCAL